MLFRSEPGWRNERPVLAPEFLGFYDEESLMGDVVFLVAPTFGVTGLF